ncbi:hypothetical protein AERO_12445 [Aeromicrobium fastidiosum]|uniref:hypothetical protein n=1 Tax=Aeromicrobium fastidiosum TaxID=52699 RepID=UPI002023579D|nr:hypothetical protein [Aeromicrobium fastidiosum]MCL8252195.1 hypothetical protein [Aeromicrobium fastidiosum]
MDLQWGSVPDWVAAVGTPTALIALLVETWQSRRQRAVETELADARQASETKHRRELQVASVAAWASDGDVKGARYRNVSAVVDNASDMAVYDVIVRLEAAGTVTVEEKHVHIVPPRTRYETEAWLAVLLGDETPSVEVELTDSHGIRWTRRNGAFEEITGTAAAND